MANLVKRIRVDQSCDQGTGNLNGHTWPGKEKVKELVIGTLLETTHESEERQSVVNLHAAANTPGPKESKTGFKLNDRLVVALRQPREFGVEGRMILGRAGKEGIDKGRPCFTATLKTVGQNETNSRGMRTGPGRVSRGLD